MTVMAGIALARACEAVAKAESGPHGGRKAEIERQGHILRGYIAAGELDAQEAMRRLTAASQTALKGDVRATAARVAREQIREAS